MHTRLNYNRQKTLQHQQKKKNKENHTHKKNPAPLAHFSKYGIKARFTNVMDNDTDAKSMHKYNVQHIFIMQQSIHFY